jgi:ribosomal protein L27
MFKFPSCLHQQIRWATKKAGGSSKNGGSSGGKSLELKRADGEKVEIGHILVRQRGLKFHPGEGVVVGRDHTIVAKRPGKMRVHYDIDRLKRVISVDDGSMYESLIFSKKVMKRELTDRMDAVEYLKKNPFERHVYVSHKMSQLQEEYKQKRQDAQQHAVTHNIRRFRLFDLTQL